MNSKRYRSDSQIDNQVTAFPAELRTDYFHFGAFPPGFSCDQGASQQYIAYPPTGTLPVLAVAPKAAPLHHQHNQKFFALRRGRTNKGCCIYFDRQDLLDQVDGFENAEYMVFDTLDSAFRYLANTDSNDAEADEFERQYSGLVSFYRLYGTSDVPLHTDLGKFAISLRLELEAFMKGEQSPLTQERVDRLKEIDFNFSGKFNRRTFSQSLEDVVRYRERNGGRYPQYNTVSQRWLAKFKSKYLDFKRGKKVKCMDVSRCKELEEAGFDWTESSSEGTVLNASPVGTPHSYLLDQRQEPLHVVEMTGCNNDSTSCDALTETLLHAESSKVAPQGANILARPSTEITRTNAITTSTSATGQISTFSRSAASMPTAPVAAKLQPPPGPDADWNIMLAAFKAVYPNGNATNIPSISITDTPLDQWIHAQQNAYTDFVTKKERKRKISGKALLTKNQVDVLKAAGFKLKEPILPSPKRPKKYLMNDYIWDKMVTEIKAFKESSGHTTPPFKNQNLREFVKAVQDEYKKLTTNKPSELTPDRIQTLKEIDFKFDGMDKPWTPAWKAKFDVLKKFKAMHGHCDVPRNYEHPDMKGLSNWVKEQRKFYHKMLKGQPTIMTPEKAEKLSQLGLTWAFFKLKNNGIGAGGRKSWDARFEELLEFHRQYGHTRVPAHFPGLGSWVQNQRAYYKLLKQNAKCPMSAEQANRLEQIGFEFV